MIVNKYNLIKLECAYFENVFSLYQEAVILNSHNFYPRAFNLAYFAMEEYAKVTVLVYLELNMFKNIPMDENYLANLFKSKLFTYHRTKIELCLLRMPDIDFDKSKKISEELCNNRLKSLYVDVKDNEVSIPSKVVTASHSQMILDIVSNLVNLSLIERKWDSVNDLSIGNLIKFYDSKKTEYQKLYFQAQFTETNDFVAKLKQLLSDKKLYNKYKKILGS